MLLSRWEVNPHAESPESEHQIGHQHDDEVADASKDLALAHADTLGDIDGERLTDARQSEQKQLKLSNVVVL